MDTQWLLGVLSLYLVCGILAVVAENELSSVDSPLRLVKRHATPAEIDKAKICKAFGCLNGHCLESEMKKFRIVCICYAGFEGKLCDRQSCPIPCSGNGTCTNDKGVYRCKCKPGFTGASCNVRETQPAVTDPKSQASQSTDIRPLQMHIVKQGQPTSIILDTLDSLISKPKISRKGKQGGASGAKGSWISTFSFNHPFHAHAVLDRNVKPKTCAPGFRCYHGDCDRDLLSQGRFRCLCQENFTGLFCDKRCNLKCRNNGLCYADPHGHQFCMCPWEFTGPLCEKRVKE